MGWKQVLAMSGRLLKRLISDPKFMFVFAMPHEYNHLSVATRMIQFLRMPTCQHPCTKSIGQFLFVGDRTVWLVVASAVAVLLDLYHM